MTSLLSREQYILLKNHQQKTSQTWLMLHLTAAQSQMRVGLPIEVYVFICKHVTFHVTVYKFRLEHGANWPLHWPAVSKSQKVD